MVEDDVQNKGKTELTYTPVYKHILLIIKTQWKSFIVTFIAVFSISWTFIEAISYLRKIDLSNDVVLQACLFVSLLIAISNMIISYLKTVPEGLENEPKDIQKVALFKKPYWEYKLTYMLLKYRLEDIDQKLDDILTSKAHIKIERKLLIKEYIGWLRIRPDNLLRMVDVAKKLLVFELFACLKREKGKELDIYKLVKVSNMIKDLYENVYQYEIEGKQMKIPEGFELAHEIQANWVIVIRDGIRQMLDTLSQIANRSLKELGTIKGEIVFEEPPRIEDFNCELNRLEGMLPILMAEEKQLF